ncbi:MAG TPA: tetratricopeptide repeat protein [Pyrinomonadaceae bacterium]|nr:tetratricopeptide repeat protein [Pyrinomonadaceae bacterium]
MRAITLCACAALVLLVGGCWWRKQAGAEAGNDNHAAALSPTPAEAATPSDEAPLPPGSDARAYFERGLQDYRRNRDQAAVEAFREAIRLDPGFAEAYYRLGLALSATGQDEESEKAFQEAVSAYEKLVKKDEEDSEAQFFLGLSYSKLGEYEKAVKAFKLAVKHAPEEDDDRFYELGLAHYKLAEYVESVRALEKALEINPDNYPAADLLERARAGRERRETFIKRQEQLRKQQEQKANANANVNANANSPGAPPAPTLPPAPAPTPVDVRPRRAEQPG